MRSRENTFPPMAVIAIVSLALAGCQKLSTAYKANPETTIDQASEDSGNFAGLSDLLVEVELNKQKNFDVLALSNADATTGRKPQISRISLKVGEPLLSVATSNGKIEIPNASKTSLNYTPQTGFRGDDLATLYLFDAKGRATSINIRFLIKNPSSNFKPSLAVRGIGCIMCHVKIHGDVVTDYGYKGDAPFNGTTKNDYFLKYIYGDYNDPNHRNVGSIAEMEGRFIVPKVEGLSVGHLSPSIDYRLSPGSTYSLASMIRAWLPDNANSTLSLRQNVEIQEKKNVFIGAPTEQRVLDLGKFKGEERFKFFPQKSGGTPLFGLVIDTSKGADKAFIKNDSTGMLVCDGDLVVKGALLLRDIKVATTTGCRIYASGAVFVSGKIEVVAQDAWPEANIQISSAKAIMVGIGSGSGVKSATESNVCGYGQDFLRERITHGWITQPVRSYTDPSLLTKAILDDAALVGPLPDSSCSPQGRAVALSRILLNAPQVHGRFQGNFTGTIIAEIALWAIGELKFYNDPVFQRVDILPLLDPTEYLKIEE